MRLLRIERADFLEESLKPLVAMTACLCKHVTLMNRLIKNDTSNLPTNTVA